jgi:transcriptional regulator with XRE-family HTH domain
MATTNFAGRLKELREQNGLSQKQLADKAGIGQRTISHLEQGVNKPSWETVQALCQALAISCEAFNQEPAARPEPSRGRPPKEKDAPAEPGKPKRPRGRPRKGKGE